MAIPFIVPKFNDTVHLCPDPVRLNQTLIRPEHKGPNINVTFPKLTDEYHMTIIDASLGYHNLKPDEKILCLTKLLYQSGRYIFTRQLFRVAPADDMFQQKIYYIFKDIPNVFGIAGNILIIRYDANSRNHDKTLR